MSSESSELRAPYIEVPGRYKHLTSVYGERLPEMFTPRYTKGEKRRFFESAIEDGGYFFYSVGDEDVRGKKFKVVSVDEDNVTLSLDDLVVKKRIEEAYDSGIIVGEDF